MMLTTSKTIFMSRISKLDKDKRAEMLSTLGVSRQALEYWMKGGMPSKDRVNTLVSLFGFKYSDFFMDAEAEDLLD